jgi:hypothetical protein
MHTKIRLFYMLFNCTVIIIIIIYCLFDNLAILKYVNNIAVTFFISNLKFVHLSLIN